VTSFAAMIADGLGLTDHEASPLLRAAMLHDIGKVALPVEVLRKKGPLGDQQMRMMRTHPRRGASILAALDPDNGVHDTILYHHECMDGSGYYGLDGGVVPRTARILAVAEQYDAMTSSTIREPVARERALDMLLDKRRTLFDSDSVEALADALRPRPTNVPLSDV
jgi:HD-GYP domain-containing protein (c-di-GMP phosphodiesterase class II)